MRRLCYLGAIALMAGTMGAVALPVSSVQAGTATPSISGGGIYTCAVSAAGTVDCWGTNSEGQLGNGAFVTTAGPSTPVAVCAVGQASCTSSTDELTGVTAVTAGGSADGGGGQHACALRADTTVVCWGDNTIGELGVGNATGPESCGTSSPCSTTPVAVVTAPGVPLAGVTAIAAGHGHTCAVLTDTTVDCWGDNSQGQLGIANGPTQICASLFVCSPTPQQVVTSLGVPLAGVTAITAGHFYSCAVLTGGSVDCWGDNGFGELGDGPPTGPKTCASPGLGSIACSPVAIPVLTEAGPALTGVTAISASHFAHTCAVLTDGSVDCWGNGALGNGATTGPKEAAPVAGLSGAIGVAVGDQDSCALLAAGGGTVECWGANFYAQVGDGTSGTSQETPVPVVTGSGTLSGVIQISGGGAHTCGLLSDGTVDCWGENAYGQLGVPTTGPDQCFPSSGCSWVAFAVPGLRLLGLAPTLVLLPSPLPPNGGPVTYAVTVAGAGPPTPTGLVTISDGHQSCTSPVIAGAGHCPLIEGPGTPFTLTANYGGDPTYASVETSLSIVSAPTGGGTVNVSGGGVTTTATASGTGAVTQTTYPTDPVQAPSFNATGNYFDVALSPASAFTSVTINACNSNVAPGTTLEWWNPAGAGSWVNVVGIPNPPTYTPGPPPPCITLTLNGSTNPTVAQLIHTVFGVAKPTAKPSRPTAVFAVPGNGGATVHWTKPASDGGKRVTRYTVTSYLAGVAKTAKTFSANATSATSGLMTLLTNAKSYTFKVTATNAVGTSPPSAASTAITVGAPTAPAQVRAQRVGAGHLKVSFASSASNGAPIQKYTATCTPSISGTTGAKANTVSPITVTGLTAGKSYTCTVKAANSRGTGPSSAPSSVTNA